MNASTGLNPSGAGQPLPEPEGPGPSEENRQPAAPTSPDQPAPLPTVASPSFPCPNPKCGEPLDSLYVAALEDAGYTFYIDEGHPRWEDEDNYTREREFRCRSCDFVITKDEQEAIAFLTTGTVPEAAKLRAAGLAREVVA